jgi:hypothetical protein
MGRISKESAGGYPRAAVCFTMVGGGKMLKIPILALALSQFELFSL